MTSSERIKARQRAERSDCLNKILASKAKYKLIVAGPGTGKTFTFGKLLEQERDGNNLAITFIKKLVEDMRSKLSCYAEVKTLHAYCKKTLHAQDEECQLVPFLTRIIESDAKILGEQFDDFGHKFQTLEVDCEEIKFYLKRGDYYEALGFDDSVYRLYAKFKDNPDMIPSFNQIVIDEFQDFNRLEVAFISKLAKKCKILIVGDDDQAIYDDRNASPKYLRRLYNSESFTKFSLPFCSRCTEVIVKATVCFIKAAQNSGHLQNRIPKRFECYWEKKEADSQKYPKLILACCSTATTVSKYIRKEIELIPPEDIEESYESGDEYPTVLIVGMRHYLQGIETCLKKYYPSVSFNPSDSSGPGIAEAYDCLLRDKRSNLGWRILVEALCDRRSLKRTILASKEGLPIMGLVNRDFRARHLKALSIIREVHSRGSASRADRAELKRLLGSYAKILIEHFTLVPENEPARMNKSNPKILLTSFKGCKGLSAGHVFLVGVHSGSIPKDQTNITDVEISQFIVALTRTRKRCHILSDLWFRSPKDKMGRWLQPHKESLFISWLPQHLMDNRGILKSQDL